MVEKNLMKSKMLIWSFQKNAFIPVLSIKIENKIIIMDIYFLSREIFSVAKSKAMFVFKPDFTSFKIVKLLLLFPSLVMA